MSPRGSCLERSSISLVSWSVEIYWFIFFHLYLQDQHVEHKEVGVSVSAGIRVETTRSLVFTYIYPIKICESEADSIEWKHWIVLIRIGKQWSSACSRWLTNGHNRQARTRLPCETFWYEEPSHGEQHRLALYSLARTNETKRFPSRAHTSRSQMFYG